MKSMIYHQNATFMMLGYRFNSYKMSGAPLHL